MPRLCRHIFILVFGKAKDYIFRRLPVTTTDTYHVREVFVEVDICISVGNMGELHAEDAVERIVAEIGVVAVAAEEEPAVVVLLQVVGVDNERLRFCHPETLIAQLHGGLLADGVEEWGEVLHPFIIHG